jgi:hypothetical protein
MSDPDLDKEMVYLAYRDIFKDKLAKLRKRGKVRDVVEKHKDHLHHRQLADSMDSEKTCKILRGLLAARLFESDSEAQAAFPTLFSPGELGNDTALIVKCVEDAPPFPDILLSPDTPLPNGTSPESTSTVGQHRIDTQSGRIKKPTRATTKSARPILQVGKGKGTGPKEVVGGGKNINLPNSTSLRINADYDISLQTQRKIQTFESGNAIAIL